MTYYAITFYRSGRQIVRRFSSLAEARDVANIIFQATGIIVGIDWVEM